MRHLFITTIMLLWVAITFGQLTGTKNIPGDYASLEAAITDLNTQGVGSGGVTINLVAGNPQTAPAGGYVITASGNFNNPIIINGNGNTITSSNALTAGAINDAFFKIIGGDYITINGFVMQEDAANTTTTASSNNMTEFGVALFYASATDGPQNCTIQNNTITLGLAYQNAMGVYANSRHTATSMTTLADITSSTGAFSNLKVLNNTISSVNLGVVLVGSATGDNMATNVEVTGNHITFGRTGIFSSYVGVSGTVYGIDMNSVLGVTVNSNTLLCNGTNTGGTLRGIYHYSNGTLPTTGSFVNNYKFNTITLTNGATTATFGIHLQNLSNLFTTNIEGDIIIIDSSSVSISANVYGIYHEGSSLYQNIKDNVLQLNLNTTGSVYAIHGGNTIPTNGTQTVQNNSIQINKTGAGGTVFGYYSYSSSPSTVFKTISNNTIENVSLTGATTFYGIFDLDGTSTSSLTKTISDNIFQNITGGTSSIAIINLNYGIHYIFNNTIDSITNGANITAITAGGSNTTLANTYNNSIYALSTTTGSITGINISASASSAVSNVYNNRIYNLSATNASSSVSGISISAGTDVTVYNNFISELYAPNASNSSYPSIAGIAALGGTNVNLYYNTVFLHATSMGTDFSTCALFASATPSNLKLNNNILVNTSTPNGTGITAAFRRSEVALSKYNSLSSNNCFYAGTPSTSNLIYYDGTNGYQTMNDFITAVSPRENSSISELPPFVNSTTAPYDLHIQTTIATGTESGGIAITGFDNDIDGDTRYGSTGYSGTGTAPDMGADEFNGIPNFTCTTPNPGYTIASNTLVCFNEKIELSLQNTISGTGITYQWKKSTDGITYTNMPSATSPTVSGYTITEPTYFVCDVTCINGPVTGTSTPVFVDFANKILTTTPDTLCGAGQATLEATSTSGSTINWYDAPTAGNIVGTGSPFVTPLISSTTSYYVAAEISNPITVTIGTGTSSSTSAGYTPFYTFYESSKNQILYRASELQAEGLSAGFITDLSFNFASVSTTAMTNFEIQMANTNVSALTTTYETGLTTVYTDTSYMPAGTGWQAITLSTPFYWDGTSNLLIQICDGNNSSYSTSSGIYYSTTTYNSHHYGYMDNGTGCAMTTPTNNSVGTNRPNIKINGQSLCSSPRVEVIATVGASTPITISNDTTVCNNTVATVQVTSGATSYTDFTWIPATDLYTDTACTIPYVAGSSANQVYMKTDSAGVYQYICSAYNSSTQCGATDTIQITVLPATVNFTATPDQICVSGSTVLNVTPTTGFGTAVFQFAESTDGATYTDIPGANGFTYTTGTLNDTTYYRWTASVGTNVCIQQQISINVNNPQVTSTTPGTRCGTGTVTLSATGSTGTTLNWYDAPTGGNLLGIGNDFTTPVISDTTSYYVEAVIDSTCISSRTEVVATVTPAPTVSISSSDTAVCAGITVTLNATSSNTDYTYAWSNGDNGQTITVTPTSYTSYVVTATDANTGCVTTAETEVDVYPLPVATATVDNSTITCGQSVLLTAGDLFMPDQLTEDFNDTTISFTTVNTSTGGTPANAAWILVPDGYVYSFNTFHSNDNSQFIMTNSDAQGNGGTTHTELISPVFSSVGVDTMSIEMYHYFRYYSGSEAKVEIYDGTQWTTLQTWTTTQGSASNFSHVVIGLPNTYLNNPNLQIRLVYDANWGYYWAIDNAGVNLYHANTFAWTSTPLGFISNVYNPTDTPSVSTQYDVVVTSVHGCTNTASVNVAVNNLPAPTITVNNLCGESELTASNYTGTLTWSTNESSDTIVVNSNNPVSLVYTDGVCISDTASVTPAPIEIPATPTLSDDTLNSCLGTTNGAFTATSNYSDFIWYADDSLTQSVGTGNTYQSQETSVGTYTYYVVALNGTCTSDAAIAVLNINALPTVTISQNGDTLYSSANSGNQWYNSTGAIAGATDSTYVVTEEDDYYVVVTDANGCSAMSNIIHVLPTAIANNAIASMISVNPNPAHGYTVVNLGKFDDAQIQIISVDGKVVYYATVNQHKHTISLNGFATGMYTVKVITNNKAIQKKLVIE